MESLKQQVFASAFGSFDPQAALSEYYKVFEHQDPEQQVSEFEPQSPKDVLDMLNEARQAGAIE